MAVWMPQCGLVHDTTDVATDIEVVAPAEVRDFVAARGGRLFVWMSAHPGLWFPTCLLEASLEPPRGRDLSFRRVEAPGFELYLEGTQRIWPKTMEFVLRRRRRVEAYWNGMAWVA
ncbi:MAG: hypothetical protein ACM3MJ_02940 [Deltaproteobacteria bacterium]